MNVEAVPARGGGGSVVQASGAKELRELPTLTPGFMPTVQKTVITATDAKESMVEIHRSR